MNRNIVSYNGISTFIADDETMGIIDKNNYIIAEGFNNIQDFQTWGIAEFERNGYVGFINTKGEIIIDGCQEVLYNTSFNTLLTFKKNNKYGVVNIYGEIIVDNLDEISNFVKGIENNTGYATVTYQGVPDLTLDNLGNITELVRGEYIPFIK